MLNFALRNTALPLCMPLMLQRLSTCQHIVSKIHMATVELDGFFNDSIFVVHDENLIAAHSTHVAVETLGGQACCGVVLQHVQQIF